MSQNFTSLINEGTGRMTNFKGAHEKLIFIPIYDCVSEKEE